MRSFSTLAALSLSALAIFASAHDSAAPAGIHRRMISRRHSARDTTAANALALINATTTNPGGQASPGNPKKSCRPPSTGSNSTTNSTSAPPPPPPASGNSSSAGLKFPELGFQMPSAVPATLDGWWADPSTEYAFVGFSYEISACQSQAQLTKDFTNIRQKFNGRYVRLYGACVETTQKMVTQASFYDRVVAAAWDAGVGVHALIWFGFEGGSLWESQRDTLYTSLTTNPKAKFVTRVVQFGSEPLFDGVLSPSVLAAQVTAYKKKLAPLGINVTVSDMAYGFQKNGGAGVVLEAMDDVHAHILPFFSTKATTGSAALPIVKSNLEWFMAQPGAKGKKIYMDENGWPSTTYSGVEANTKAAVADVASEQQYFAVLDEQCAYFKATNGGIAWFFHIYSDDQEPGYGLYSTSGKLKFPFAPKTSC